MTSGTKERVELRKALNRLIHECRAVLAFEVELREISVLGNTNVNVFKLRIEEAEVALAAVEREGAREARLIEAAKWVIEWEDDYRKLNNLGRNPPMVFIHLAKVVAEAALERTTQSPVAPASAKEESHG